LAGPRARPQPNTVLGLRAKLSGFQAFANAVGVDQLEDGCSELVLRGLPLRRGCEGGAQRTIHVDPAVIVHEPALEDLRVTMKGTRRG